MGLLPMGADILPPSDDRVFKLLLTSPDAKPGLINLISSIIGRTVVDVVLHPNELAPNRYLLKSRAVRCQLQNR